MNKLPDIRHSAIFAGELSHVRKKHRHHHFRYRVFMMYLDLDELDTVFSLSPWWSFRRWSPARFRAEDYFFDPDKGSIKDTVSDFVTRESGERFQGRIALLTNVRYFGFIINPISCYYCFDSDDCLKYVVAEVTNTPWKERQHYLLKVEGQLSSEKHFEYRFKKLMHVSPFMENDQEYRFKGNQPPEQPGGQLLINLQNLEAQQVVFNARLDLQREEISGAALNKMLIRFPLMTVKIVVAIHWQALKLFLKGVPLVKHVTKQELVDEV